MTRDLIRSLPILALASILSLDLAGQCPSLTLSPGTAQATTCSGTPFTVVPIANHWNAVGVRGLADWNMTMVPAISAAPGLLQDFVLSNGHLGAPAFTTGVINCFGPPLPGNLQQAVVVSMQVNAPMTQTMPANDGIRLFEFEVLAGGNYTVNASSSAALTWALFAPGSNAYWVSRAAQMVSAPASSPITLALTPGWHALVVFREGYSAAVQTTVTASVTCGATPIVPVPGSTVAISQSCQYFNLQPSPSHWNLVAITSQSDWSVNIGGVVSSSAGSACDVLVANGHQGAVSGGDATFNRVSGQMPASAVHKSASFVPIGSSVSSTWTASTVAMLVEFWAPGTGYYIVTVLGPAGLDCEVQIDDGTPAWRDRGASSLPAAVNATTTVPLSPGYHAILVSRPNGAGGGGNVTIQVDQIPNPIPTISSFDPIALEAGSAQPLPLTVHGNWFVPSSLVRWNGQVLATSYVSHSELTATVPAALLAQSGTVTVTVITPPPAGGLSLPSPYHVAGPAISALSPQGSSVPYVPAAGSFPLTVYGGGFLPGCQVYADGTPLPTTQIGSGALQVMMPLSFPGLNAPGGIAINVANGTATSNTLAFTIGTTPNSGTVTLVPPAPAPGSVASLEVEIGIVDWQLTVFASNPPPSAWTYAGLLVGIELQSLIPLADGLGLFGAFDGSKSGVNGYPQHFSFRINGLAMPNPPIGATIAIQALRTAPGTAAGITLTWPRTINF